MAVNSSFMVVEWGTNSPHGEMFRFVYNFTEDACGDEVAIPFGGVCYWDFDTLLSDQRFPGSPRMPAVPIGATTAPEAYVTINYAAGVGGFPSTAHQSNLGSCEYAAVGVGQLAARQTWNTLIGMPAGICVIENANLIAMVYYIQGVGGIGSPQNCYIVKTRGIVQALCYGDADIAVGDYLEGVIGQWYLIRDAANANEGTFIALEAYTAAAAALIWVMPTNVVY